MYLSKLPGRIGHSQLYIHAVDADLEAGMNNFAFGMSDPCCVAQSPGAPRRNDAAPDPANDRD
jgi:hypothetical protein